MTAQDVLETQSLQLLERNCENFAPIQNNKKRRLVISILELFLGRHLRKEQAMRALKPQPYQTEGHLYAFYVEQLSLFDLDKLPAGKRQALNNTHLSAL